MTKSEMKMWMVTHGDTKVTLFWSPLLDWFSPHLPRRLPILLAAFPHTWPVPASVTHLRVFLSACRVFEAVRI